jgi:type IV pilus assembly protein PilB
MSIRHRYLGEMLIEAGMLTRRQLDDALQAQVETGRRIGDILKDRGWVTEQQIMEMLEFQLGIPYIDVSATYIPSDMNQYVPITVAQRHTLVPVKAEGGRLWVAMEDPLSIVAIDDVRTVSGLDVSPMIGRGPAITQAINKLYGGRQAEQALEDFKREGPAEDADLDAIDLSDGVNSAPIVRLVNTILEQAANLRASDVHIEPGEGSVRVRFRVDGALSIALTPPLNTHAAIIARIKIMSNLDIAEKRRPQDGRLDLTYGGRNIDVRVSTMPTVYGEKVVLRLLDRASFLITKECLGMTKANMEKFEMLLRHPHGILLISGPTGSGKTTTLYAMLNELNDPGKNIITIEDPVEYVMAGLNQTQVNVKAGLTFASGLRSILRQDPNIIMVGEIRDEETVEIAIRAAITGHLVLSTIHTNDAASTITRMEDMGVEPFLLSASLVGVMAQRLVRKLCPQCSEDYDPEPELLRLIGLSPGAGRFRRSRGCIACNGTGTKGRQAVYEILTLDNAHREMIHSRAPLQKIIDYSRQNGMTMLNEECARLAAAGVISPEEAVRVAFRQD